MLLTPLSFPSPFPFPLFLPPHLFLSFPLLFYPLLPCPFPSHSGLDLEALIVLGKRSIIESCPHVHFWGRASLSGRLALQLWSSFWVLSSSWAYIPVPTHPASALSVGHFLKSFVYTDIYSTPILYRRQWHKHIIQTNPKAVLYNTCSFPASYLP